MQPPIMLNRSTDVSTLLTMTPATLLALGHRSTSGGSVAANGTAAAGKTQPFQPTAVSTFKTQTAQRKLDAQQVSTATALRAAMAKAGTPPAGTVEFSMGSDGKLAVQGSAQDRATTNAFLAADTSKPSFTDRLTGLLQQADALGSTTRQTTALSQAARYAGTASNVMSLYTTLLQQQSPATPAVLSVSTASSALGYAGALDAQA